jgi:hypothetical protein
LNKDSLRALNVYLTQDHFLPSGPLLLGSREKGKLQGGMSECVITKRVAALGEEIGGTVTGLSPHDCATQAMPSRYIEAAKIANDEVALETDECTESRRIFKNEAKIIFQPRIAYG